MTGRHGDAEYELVEAFTASDELLHSGTKYDYILKDNTVAPK